MAYVGQDFTTANPLESEVYGFDWVNDLNAGDTLASATFALFVFRGIDSAVSSKLTGGVVIKNGTQAGQRISGLVSGVIYRLEGYGVPTSDSSAVIQLWSHIECKAPN